MKNQNSFVVTKSFKTTGTPISILILFVACTFVAAEPTNNQPTVTNVDTVWNDLQQVAILPKPPPDWKTQPPTDAQGEKFNKQVVDAATVAAGKAKAFYTRFPESTNVVSARKLECQMLETVFNYGDGSQTAVTAWGDAQEALLADPKLTDEERFELRMAILQRKRFDQRLDQKSREVERENGLRELINDYPKKEEPYERLLNLAANSPNEKARSIANEVLKLPISENVKTKAEGILRRLDAAGNPLAIKFTALDGKEVDLSQMKGRVVLINFWATWCGPCVGEIPHVKDTYKKLHPKGFEVIGISFDGGFGFASGKQALENFVQKNEMPWPQYFDGQAWKNKFGIQYGISSIPTMWLVDKKGNLRETNARNDLQGKIEKLLAE